MFDDLLAANARYRDRFDLIGLQGRAARGLAVITCMDSRIEPLTMLGLVPGDAKLLRNAGARVTDDMLRSLVLATNLLDVDRICIVQHTDCAMTKTTDEQLQARLGSKHGVDASDWEFHTIVDQDKVLAEDIARVLECSLVPAGVTVGGFIYDVDTGELRPVATKYVKQ